MPQTAFDELASFGKSQDEPAGSRQLRKRSRNLFDETSPLRTGLIDRASQFLSGDLDVTSSPLFGPLKGAVESQFENARENILASSPRGGALTDALSDLDFSRASELTRGIGDIAQGELGRAFSLATGTPLTASLGGLGQSGAIQADIARTNAEATSRNKQTIGESAQGAGQAMGGK